MSERPRVVAIGYALVDEKVRDILLPDTIGDLEAGEQFLAATAIEAETAGGSVANMATAFEARSGFATRLYYATSEDKRGAVFRNATARLGKPQVEKGGFTGFCILSLSREGQIADEITLYGVAPKARVPRDERALENHLVISNVNTLRNKDMLEQVNDLTARLDAKHGIFALRLSGAHSLLASSEAAQEVLGNLPCTPHIVFGNRAELDNVVASPATGTGADDVLPDSRVLIITNGSDETLVRYEGEISQVRIAASSNVMDVTGAGDHLTGVTLAELMKQPYSEWRLPDIHRAVKIGALAASRVIQITDSRLPRSEVQSIRLSQ